MNQTIKEIVDTKFNYYSTNSKIFQTNKKVVHCPKRFKIFTPNGFRWMTKKQLQDGDILGVESIKYPDRWYYNGDFYAFDKIYDLGPAEGKFDTLYEEKTDDNR